METAELLARLMNHVRLAVQLARLPVARLRFEQQRNPEASAASTPCSPVPIRATS